MSKSDVLELKLLLLSNSLAEPKFSTMLQLVHGNPASLKLFLGRMSQCTKDGKRETSYRLTDLRNTAICRAQID